jgi:hypothetical protein
MLPWGKSVVGTPPTLTLGVHLKREVCGLNHPDRNFRLRESSREHGKHTLVSCLAPSDHRFLAHVLVRILEAPHESFTDFVRIDIA